MRILIFRIPSLRLIALFGSRTLLMSHCDSIALTFAYSTFYTHPPLSEVWLAPELWEPSETCSFLVPHSLTLPEYLAQFECKLDYY